MNLHARSRPKLTVLASQLMEIPKIGRKWAMAFAAALMGTSLFLFSTISSFAAFTGMNLLEYWAQSREFSAPSSSFSSFSCSHRFPSPSLVIYHHLSNVLMHEHLRSLCRPPLRLYAGGLPCPLPRFRLGDCFYPRTPLFNRCTYCCWHNILAAQ